MSIKLKLLTRREIIQIWKSQTDEMLDSYCCPKCRNILLDYGDRYFCENKDCSQGYILKSEVLK